MKRIVLAGIAAAGLAATSHAQSFPSVNSVGFVPVTVPAAGGFVQLGVNLQKIGGNGTIGAVELFGSNQLVRANAPAGGTQVFIWNGATYDILYQRLDGRFRLSTGAYTNYQFATGSAVWLKSPATSAVAKVIHLAAELLAGAGTQRAVPQGYTMVANPFASPWYLNGTNMTWVADGAKRGAAGNADNIFVWNGSGYDIYYLRTSNSNWVNAANNAKMTNPVPVGAGFWYLARTNFTSRIPRLTGL